MYLIICYFAFSVFLHIFWQFLVCIGLISFSLKLAACSLVQEEAESQQDSLNPDVQRGRQKNQQNSYKGCVSSPKAGLSHFYIASYCRPLARKRTVHLSATYWSGASCSSPPERHLETKRGSSQEETGLRITSLITCYSYPLIEPGFLICQLSVFEKQRLQQLLYWWETLPSRWLAILFNGCWNYKEHVFAYSYLGSPR